MADPYIKLEHITKSFDSVYANKDISVELSWHIKINIVNSITGGIKQ